MIRVAMNTITAPLRAAAGDRCVRHQQLRLALLGMRRQLRRSPPAAVQRRRRVRCVQLEMIADRPGRAVWQRRQAMTRDDAGEAMRRCWGLNAGVVAAVWEEWRSQVELWDEARPTVREGGTRLYEWLFGETLQAQLRQRLAAKAFMGWYRQKRWVAAARIIDAIWEQNGGGPGETDAEGRAAVEYVVEQTEWQAYEERCVTLEAMQIAGAAVARKRKRSGAPRRGGQRKRKRESGKGRGGRGRGQGGSGQNSGAASAKAARRWPGEAGQTPAERRESRATARRLERDAVRRRERAEDAQRRREAALAAEAEHARIWDGPRTIVPHCTPRPLHPWEQRAPRAPVTPSQRAPQAERATAIVGSKRARTISMAVAAGERAEAVCVRRFGTGPVLRLRGGVPVCGDTSDR